MDNAKNPADLRPPDLGKGRGKPGKAGGWTSLRRAIGFSVAAGLAALVLTSTLPPLVADQSDRAVVNAPVTLLTAPITGEVRSLSAAPGAHIGARFRVAEVVNDRVDRTTLITLEGKQSDTQENLRAIRAKRDSDKRFIEALSEDIARQTAVVQARYQSDIVDLQAQVGAAEATAEEKKQVMGRQADMVARGVAAPEMIKAATQQHAAAQFQKESTVAKLATKQAQLDSARRGIFVGDDVHDLAALIQKRRDMGLDVQRLTIEETQVAAAVGDQSKLLDSERSRLASLERSSVDTSGPGEVLNVGASVGRHVTAGDTLARMIDCDASFVVAIFSYRQGSDLAAGARVTIDAGAAGKREGTVTEVLPKTSDKVDDTYAVPFPQTERRELYVLVKPDRPLRSLVMDGRDHCDIGRWVTVTGVNGWVPSTSVIWHEASRFIGSGMEAAAKGLPSLWAAKSGPYGQLSAHHTSADGPVERGREAKLGRI